MRFICICPNIPFRYDFLEQFLVLLLVRFLEVAEGGTTIISVLSAVVVQEETPVKSVNLKLSTRVNKEVQGDMEKARPTTTSLGKAHRTRFAVDRRPKGQTAANPPPVRCLTPVSRGAHLISEVA